MDDTQKQVAAQCRAVAHMAAAIAKVHAELAELFVTMPEMSIADQVGARTANLMNNLGDVLNGMDAVTGEDAWLTPIFEESRRRWPS